MEGDVTEAAGVRADGPGDAGYGQGMAHLQAGRWREAIASFEAVLRARPGDPAAQRALGEARFKAGLDKKARVRAKRWILPGRATVVRLLILLVLAVVAVQGARLVAAQAAPLLAQYREQQRLNGLIRDGNKLLEGGNLDAADAAYKQVLAADPQNQAALAGLDNVALERQITGLYDQGVALQESGDCTGAVEAFTQVHLLRTPYEDVSQRIEQCQRQKTLAELFLGADADAQAGRLADALSKYGELQQLDLNYQSDLVLQRIYELNMRLGRQLIEQDPPAGEAVSEALGHFEAALQVTPRDPAAGLERQLALQFLDGQARYDSGDWAGAITALQPVLTQRPGYLHGLVANRLYQAYLNRGDQYRDAGNCNTAYGFYQTAAALPVPNVAVALASMATIQPCLTPTPTPTPTRTPTPIPTVTPIPPPTITPRPTAVPTPWTLQRLHNQILFKASKDPDYLLVEPDLWVMNPDGTNRRRVGPFSAYEAAVEALHSQYAYSPDGQYLVSVGYKAQLYVTKPLDPKFGSLPITDFNALCYDPQWSPDGGYIVFVSNKGTGDNIWIMEADGDKKMILTINTWEWDKHPAWSPDSQRIVYWSNSNGLAQIYVMDTAGRYQTNISQSQLNEWDPIWVR